MYETKRIYMTDVTYTERANSRDLLAKFQFWPNNLPFVRRRSNARLSAPTLAGHQLTKTEKAAPTPKRPLRRLNSQRALVR
jgi:hypothetical protein